VRRQPIGFRLLALANARRNAGTHGHRGIGAHGDHRRAPSPGVGAVAGGALGGLAGSNVGQGSGSTAGAIVGAVLGGLAGQAIEEQGSKKDGVEITIKLDSGQIIAVTQEADEQFHPGERVRILSGDGVTRVSH
jgi:outer membrane lipoprotein SlyB